MTFRLTLTDVSAKIEAAFSPAASNSMADQIAEAATDAIHDAAELMKTRGRANIAAAGFGRKWQNAWRVTVYPQDGVSIDAALWAYHKIPYSLVFETGARIASAKGKLWIPLSTTPRGKGVRGDPLSMSPRRMREKGVKLVTIKRPGRQPLLGTAVRLPKSQAMGRNLALSLSKLRKGAEGSRGVIRTVPLFVGVDYAQIQKRFDVTGVAESVRRELPDLYLKRSRPE